MHKGDLTKWANNVDSWAARCALTGDELPGPDELRDMADRVSGGELDCTQLDILCDMIDSRIAKWLGDA